MAIDDVFKKEKIIHKFIPIKITNLNTLIPTLIMLILMLFFLFIMFSNYEIVHKDVLDKNYRLITNSSDAKASTEAFFNKEMFCEYNNHKISISKYSKTNSNIAKVNGD